MGTVPFGPCRIANCVKVGDNLGTVPFGPCLVSHIGQTFLAQKGQSPCVRQSQRGQLANLSPTLTRSASWSLANRIKVSQLHGDCPLWPRKPLLIRKAQHGPKGTVPKLSLTLVRLKETDRGRFFLCREIFPYMSSPARHKKNRPLSASPTLSMLANCTIFATLWKKTPTTRWS